MRLSLLSIIVLAVLFGCWAAFAFLLIARKRNQPAAPTTHRDKASDFGLVLQLLSYPILFAGRSYLGLITEPRLRSIVFAILACALGVTSIWIIKASLNALGREWSVRARLVENHRLATTGPYRFVRHPIYTGMLGMLLASGIAVSTWQLILPALIVFLLGTFIRIRSEERLLREAFGTEFDNYSRRVWAIIPGLF